MSTFLANFPKMGILPNRIRGIFYILKGDRHNESDLVGVLAKNSCEEKIVLKKDNLVLYGLGELLIRFSHRLT